MPASICGRGNFPDTSSRNVGQIRAGAFVDSTVCTRSSLVVASYSILQLGQYTLVLSSVVVASGAGACAGAVATASSRVASEATASACVAGQATASSCVAGQATPLVVSSGSSARVAGQATSMVVAVVVSSACAARQVASLVVGLAGSYLAVALREDGSRWRKICKQEEQWGRG